MASTSKVRRWWAERRCVKGVPITLMGRTPVYVQPETIDIWRAFETALYDHGYRDVRVVGSYRRCPRGIAGRTCQENGSWCSLHNYCLAVDLDPRSYGNPHFRRRYGNGWDFNDCKLTEQQVRAVEAIRTTSGAQAIRWLGWSIGDTMHFQINVPPTDTTVGDQGGDMMLSRGMKGEAVRAMQEMLLRWKPDSLPRWGADGSFGEETEVAVKALQAAFDLPSTGRVDTATTLILAQYATDAANLDGVVRRGETVTLR